MDSIDPMMESNSEINNAKDDYACTGLLRLQLLDKCMALLLEGVAITIGVVQVSQSSDCVDSTQLGPNDVKVFILESNGHNAIPND